jgi:hypothetical protein
MKAILKSSVANAITAIITIPIGILIGLSFWHPVRGPNSDPPPPAKEKYHAFPAPRCGKDCEWRDTVGDNIWTLVDGNKQVVARVFNVLSYPGYWYVQVNSSIRVMESEWGTMDAAKRRAEDLVKK